MSLFVKLDNKKIQQLRLQHCWSQEELAVTAGLSIRTIQRVEKMAMPRLKQAKRLQLCLNSHRHNCSNNPPLNMLPFTF